MGFHGMRAVFMGLILLCLLPHAEQFGFSSSPLLRKPTSSSFLASSPSSPLPSPPSSSHRARTSKTLSTNMLFSTPDIGNIFFAPRDQLFFNPIWYPYFARKTHLSPVEELKRKGVDAWMLEQPVGFLNITVNIRMTVFRLKDGSLLVKDPIAPTEECRSMLSSLGGEVSHIVLGSTAIEHKFFARAFVDYYQQATFYACPGVFSYVPGPWGADLAPSGLGLFVDAIRPVRIDGWLTEGFREATLNGVVYPQSAVPSWAKEFDHSLLFLDTSIANLGECALFHKASGALLVTDSMTYIDSSRLDWLSEEGTRDRSFPFNLYPHEWSPERKKATDMMQIFTIQTPYGDQEFSDLTDKLYVCPQLRLFVFETDPQLTRKWLQKVLSWDTKFVIASHFDAPVRLGRGDIKDAFAFVLDRQRSSQRLSPLPGDYCMGVQKAVQVILRRTLFKGRLDRGEMVSLEYAGEDEGGVYRGDIELPLVGRIKV